VSVEVFEQISEGVFLCDTDGRLLYLNPSAERLVGDKREALLGRIGWEVLPRQVARPLHAAFERVVRGGGPESLEQLDTSWGRWFDVRFLRVPEGVCIIARDITARRRAEAERAPQQARLCELAQAERRRAEEASRLKDEFLVTVSHELRTPLTAMLGWLQLLRSGRLPPEKQARALETVERNARVQAQLIEDLLDVSRIITGQLRLEVEPMELADAVHAALAVVRPAAEARGVRLRAALDPEASPFLGDPHRLQQVVWNLLSNAVKFTPEGGRVEVRLRREGERAVLEVEDTGQGIEPDFLPHVFERFRKAEGGSHGGLGLGLAIVRYLVELHGGRVEARSEGVGRGATFTVRLPVAHAHAEAAPAERHLPFVS
jgi:PAS domain S-box-containing protein